MKRYLIKLKPLTPYFFGNERGFGYTPGKNEHYIVHSNLLPQQTALLGMLRREILVGQTRVLPADEFRLKDDFSYSSKEKTRMDAWIGPDSFIMKDSNTRQDFGLIQKISPSFVINTDKPENRYYMPLPLDHQQGKDNYGKKYTPLKMNPQKTPVLMDDCREINLPHGYEAKNWRNGYWLEINPKNKDNNHIVKQSDIFIPEERIGIKKTASGNTERESFFKLCYYNLRSQYHFGFIVELDFRLPERSLVFLGGERSVFAMTVQETELRFENLILPAAEDRVILWSDAWLGIGKQFDYIDFAISQSVDFRNIQVDWKAEHMKNINARHRKIKYKYGLLKRGSVLYTDEPDKLRQYICSFENLVQIGYNIVNKGGDKG